MAREWNADELLELARSYQPACILTAAAELGLFDILAGGRLSGADVAKALGTDPRATSVLLDALAALTILEKHDERYILAPDTARLLRRNSPMSVLSMLQHQANCLSRWAQLAKVVQTGRPEERQPSVQGEQSDEEAFIDAMHVVSTPVASELLEQLRLPTFRHLLDIGGASGTWTIAFLRTQPDATATLFDLPHVIPMARRRITEANLGDRVSFVAGDFYVDPLPSGADLAWLGAIVHQNSRAQNRHLFTAIAGALAEGGRVLVRDMLMDESRTTPVAGALFAINMLVATAGGGTFTLSDLQKDLEDAGFTKVSVLRRDEGMNSVIQAVKS